MCGLYVSVMCSFFAVVCENGCVELRLAKDYEQQFSYEHEIIHVRQVNSANDIPRRLSGRTRGPSNIGASSTLNNEVSHALQS